MPLKGLKTILVLLPDIKTNYGYKPIVTIYLLFVPSQYPYWVDTAPNVWPPTSIEMFESSDCSFSLDNLFFEKPTVHKVWVHRNAPCHPSLFLLCQVNMCCTILVSFWQKALATGGQSMAAGSASIFFWDFSHSGYAGGCRVSLQPIQYVMLRIRLNSFSLDLSKLLSSWPIKVRLNLTVWLTDTIVWMGLKPFPISLTFINWHLSLRIYIVIFISVGRVLIYFKYEAPLQNKCLFL